MSPDNPRNWNFSTVMLCRSGRSFTIGKRLFCDRIPGLFTGFGQGGLYGTLTSPGGDQGLCTAPQAVVPFQWCLLQFLQLCSDEQEKLLLHFSSMAIAGFRLLRVVILF